MSRTLALSGLAAVALALATAALASPLPQPPPPDESGRDYAKAYCSSCHAVGRHGASPNPDAPTFREVANRYPEEQMNQALAEGFVVGHPKMPRFVMSPERMDEMIAYIRTLRTR
jgi:cytochrome c